LRVASTDIHERSKHKNIAYRFLSPGKIAVAIAMTFFGYVPPHA
jgi:hypothetical protein